MPKKKIFIADDQEDILLLLKDFLTHHDLEVMILKEPKNILISVISFKPDLILLDLLMPNLGGFEICEILNKNVETREIPIIIISGFGNLGDIKKAYSLGAVGYFVKPFSLNDLFTKIIKTINNKETQL
ncbi:MAG: response regulator [Candidatus Omnitrophota bacterium]